MLGFFTHKAFVLNSPDHHPTLSWTAVKRTRQLLFVALAGLAGTATASACTDNKLSVNYYACRAEEEAKAAADKLAAETKAAADKLAADTQAAADAAAAKLAADAKAAADKLAADTKAAAAAAAAKLAADTKAAAAKLNDPPAIAKGFASAADQTAKLATAGYSDATKVLTNYANAAEIATYNSAAMAQQYANLAAADSQAYSYGGYASLKARLIAESLPLTAADVAKLKTAYNTAKAGALAAYKAASPFLNVGLNDGTKLWDLIGGACYSNAQSSGAAAEATVNPAFQAMKHLSAADIGLLNQITRALLSGKAGDQTLVAAMKQIGQDIGIVKNIKTQYNIPETYGASTWGISVSASAAWIVGASQTFSFNMNTAPFTNGRYGYSIASVSGPTVVLGTNDAVPGFSFAISLSLGTGDSTLANQGVSFATGVSGGPFSAELGWVFPDITMDNVAKAFDALKKAEQAMVAATKKGASGKALLTAAYKTGNHAFDAALGPLQSTIGTMCSVPGISAGLGVTFGADVTSVPGYSSILWSGRL